LATIMWRTQKSRLECARSTLHLALVMSSLLAEVDP
jgi:hypothetical protein